MWISGSKYAPNLDIRQTKCVQMLDIRQTKMCAEARYTPGSGPKCFHYITRNCSEQVKYIWGKEGAQTMERGIDKYTNKRTIII